MRVNQIAAAILLGFVILSATLACLGRYETAASGGGVFVTDRWTGDTQVCFFGNAGDHCFHIYPAK